MKENKSHKFFTGHKNFSHKYEPKVGVIVANLGTPDAPTKEALKIYLREFLNDPRIIEVPRLLWKIILEGIILRTRPKRVAKLYASIWREGGSPLLIYTKGIVDKLRELFSKDMGTPVEVVVGMRYGNPSMRNAIMELKDKGCSKIIFLPLFAQYSSTTVGSAFDGLVDEMKKLRWVPDLRTIHTFHDYDGYTDSLASNVKKHWEKNGRGEKLLLSFHGVPLRYILAGDPYHCHCHKTGRLLAEKLGLDKSEYIVAFQSQFGKEEWVKPATDKTIKGLAEAGLKKLDVICPGFICDCLETIEEIDVENREIFLHNGGEVYNYIPCVNDGDQFVEALRKLILREGQGWIEGREQFDSQKYLEEANKTEKLYQERRALNEQKFY